MRVRRERIERTGRASGKGELRGSGGVLIKRGRDGIAAEARQMEAEKRNMDRWSTRTRYTTPAYRLGWDGVDWRK